MRQANQEQQQNGYLHDFGLKKMLFKYEHQNRQLKTQIKALTERLSDLLEKKQNDKQKQHSLSKNIHNQIYQQYLKKELNSLFQQIEQGKKQIKQYKQNINENQEEKYIRYINQTKLLDKQLLQLKNKLKQTGSSSTNKYAEDITNINTNYQLKIQQSQKILDDLKKSIRQLEKTRDENNKQDIKKHQRFIDLGIKNRQITHEPSKQIVQEEAPSPKKKGLWHMQYTEENYKTISQQLLKLKKQKQQVLNSIRSQNDVMKQKLQHLQKQYNSLDQQLRLPIIQTPQRYIPNKIMQTQRTIQHSSRGLQKEDKKFLGSSSYQRQNDKNFVPKQSHQETWISSMTSKSGIDWNDENYKSTIIGANLWMDGYLLGIQFLHTFGQTPQHLHMPFKKLVPIQYRLTGSDYLQNVIIFINENKIVGIEFISKNGRNDTFGNIKTKAKAFNFNIKKPEKPVYSRGTFTVLKDNSSVVVKLGFQII